MTESAPSRAPMIVVGVAVAAVVVVFAVVLLVGGSDPDPVAEPPSGSDPATPTDDAATSDECESVHAGHSLMMWNPVMADEMLDAECPWPYPPFDEPFEPVDGGAEAISAPFEPHRYDELWAMIGRLDVGVCEVRSLPDPPGDGFAFGFVYVLAEPGCADRDAAVDLVVREFASASTRDRAARSVAGSVVLGRWVIAVDGDDPGRRTALLEALDDLGAVAA